MSSTNMSIDTGSFIFKQQIFHQHRWLDRLDSQNPFLNNRLYPTMKRALDLVLAILAMPVLLPLFALIAFLIKLEDPRGSILFVQQRTGKGGQRFNMYKFRTMVPNAEELKKQLVQVNEDGELTAPLKLDYDPRITRIGRVLRKTSLDELPQVINIFKGEMSWVGPRPTSFGLKSYELWHTTRLDVVPGITGLWQLYGRGDVNFDTWLYWDSLYIERKCLWLDLQIILRTVLAVLERRGAH